MSAHHGSPQHKHLPDDFRSLGKRLSNWGRWGVGDRIGTLNFITQAKVVAAATKIRAGKLFDLGIPVGANGPQIGGGRTNPVHHMSISPLDFRDRDDGLIIADDYVFMPLQSVTQWDGLAHVGYDAMLYNGVSASTITTMAGSTELSIDQIATKGVAGRGVLLDIAALNGVDMLNSGHAITIRELENAERRQGTSVASGDILLVRTGWIRRFLVDHSPKAYWEPNPGLDYHCVEWLHDRQVAAVASDNWSLEVMPVGAHGFALPFHCVAIRDLGMTIGEIFDLEALAADCAADGVWDFFFTAPPLKVTGGVGSPITPLALK